MWLVLQYFRDPLRHQVLAKAGPVNQTFGLVLGLMGLIYFASVMGVFGMEINVVLARRLWPRAPADAVHRQRRAHRGRPPGVRRLRQAQRLGFETVEVTFTDTQKLRMLEAAAEDDGADHRVLTACRETIGTPAGCRDLVGEEHRDPQLLRRRVPCAAGGR